MISRVPVLLLVAVLAAGCGEKAGPFAEQAPPSPTRTVAPTYDPDLEPAEAVLALVPQSATVVTVTDFDEVRAQLGVPDLSSEDPVTDTVAFWERAASEAPLLTEGLLRPVNSELMLDHGFTQDDVAWEAHFTGPEVNGYVLALRPDLDMGRVEEAVRDGVGPLAGAEVVARHHLVSSGTAERGDPVWAADPRWRGLVGQPAEATYLHRGCVPLDVALGPDAGDEELEELLGAVPVTSLGDLPGFAVGFGDHNATVRMEKNRDDLFERLDVGRDWPMPGFGEAFRTGVGDPATGRIGYTVPRPGRAAALALLGELPFGICNEVVPIAGSTGQ